MAVTVKENANPEIMLEETKDILEVQFQLLKHLGNREDATAIEARDLRDKLARDRVVLENEARRKRGSRVGHNIFFTKKPHYQS